MNGLRNTSFKSDLKENSELELELTTSSGAISVTGGSFLKHDNGSSKNQLTYTGTNPALLMMTIKSKTAFNSSLFLQIPLKINDDVLVLGMATPGADTSYDKILRGQTFFKISRGDIVEFLTVDTKYIRSDSPTIGFNISALTLEIVYK